ncbi:MAG TPA: BTAD domain-containing putative transcriptional regulator [Nakamurella sp.]
MLRLRVLGALDAALESGERVVRPDLGGPRQRSVLALLLVARGQVVSVDRLVEDLWNGEAPPRAIGALQAYVSHLRRALEPDRAPRTPATILVSEPPGYAIRVPPDAVDAWRFESLVRRAAEPGQQGRARHLLQEALDLWRGPAFAEFGTEAWAATEVGRLESLRIVARERWCEAVLREGDAAEAVLAADVLTREFPLREEGWRLLAMGLYVTGRQADALAALRRARDILADELGLDPGAALLEVEADVLAQRLRLPTSPRAADPDPAVASAAQSGPGPAPAARTGASSPKAAGENATDGSFVGREAELNALHGAAGDARTGSDRRVVLVAGEAGAGKSVLLDRFAQELRADRWRLAVGRCPESDGAPPAWAWVEVIRALAADIDPGGFAGALTPLLDETARPAPEADASFGRFLLSRALVGYLTAAARIGPLAIVLDDLHRGDSETLALLDTVATVAAGVPLLIVAAYRPAEVLEGLRDSLAGLAALPPTRLALPGLDATQAARLIRSVAGTQPDPATLAALVERTAGNPFYLAESARLLGSEGSLVAVSKVPEGVRDVLRRRFARLPEVTVSILRLAAVIGRDVDIDVLVLAAEVDEDTVLDALEAGVLAGLLLEPAPGRVRFAHVLVRDTLFGDAPRLRRGRWHGRIADAILAVHPEDAVALAHHCHHAGTAATARRAVDAGVRAADMAVARYAHETAAELYEQALADLDRVTDPGPVDPDVGTNGADPRLAERVDLLGRLARSQLAAGAGVRALATRKQAIRAADGAGRLDLLIRSLTAWDLPTPWISRPYGVVDDEMVGMIHRALASTGPVPDDATRCRLLCVLVGELDEADVAMPLAVAAEDLARRTGDPVLLGLALHAEVGFTFPERDLAGVRRIARELCEIGRQPGLAVFALIGQYAEVRAAGVHADHDRMARHVDRIDELVARYRWRQAIGLSSMHRGAIAHIAGRLDEAEAHYARAAESIRTSGALDAAGIAMLAFLTLRITQGRAAELVDSLAVVDTRASDVVADLFAIPLLAVGRRDEAIEIRRRIRPVRRDFFHGLLLTLRGIIVATLADPVEAASIYPDLMAYRGQVGGGGSGSFAVGPVDTVLGDLVALLGDRARAREHYAAAVDLAGTCGNRIWAEQAAVRLRALG